MAREVGNDEPAIAAERPREQEPALLVASESVHEHERRPAVAGGAPVVGHAHAIDDGHLEAQARVGARCS
jgi:hypothetical protein